MDQILFDLDNDKVTGARLCKLQKGIWPHRHHLLLSNLELIGIEKDFLPLFTDYMRGS